MFKKMKSGGRKVVAGMACLAIIAGSIGCTAAEKGASTVAGLGGLLTYGAMKATGHSDRDSAAAAAGVAALGGGVTYAYQKEKEAKLREALEAREGFRVERTKEGNLLINASGKVLFDTAEHTLTPEAQEALIEIANILNVDEAKEAGFALELAIEGHADSRGSEEYNQKLSERRALAAKGYLVQQGMPPRSIIAYGKGEMEPIAPNGTAAGRAENRRVEFELYIRDLANQNVR